MSIPRALAAIGLAILTGCAQQAPPPSTAAARSEDPASAVTADAIAAHVAALDAIAAEHGGTRASGSAGYDASVDYVVEQLSALGLGVERREFDYPSFEQIEPATVAIEGGATLEGDDLVKSMLYGAAGSASGPLAAVADGCVDDAFADLADDAVVMVPSGDCFRREQVMRAQDAGASAFIGVYPSWPEGQIGRPTLIEPGGIEIPALAGGADLMAALEEAGSDAGADPTVSVSVATRTERATSANVVATLNDATGNVMVVGAHLDSVQDGPGVNDDGSGVAAVLEIAAALAEADLGTRRVEFALWGAEELGSHGSRAYVEALGDPGDEVAGYINLDMLGSPNGGRFVYAEQSAPAGSELIGQALGRGLDRQGKGWMPVDIGGRSDHGPFMAAGIPTGGVFSGASDPLTSEHAEIFDGEVGEPMDACYHLPCDDADNVDVDLAAELARAVAFAIVELAAD